MILFKKAKDLRNWLDAQRKNGLSCGFVPTMGALHAGHISLLESSRKDNRVTICSIFINPTQFNDTRDFEQYPVTIESDIEKLEAGGCDVLFLPSVKEMYPDWPAFNKKQYDLGYLEKILEGKFRPGHFQGVCLVVHRLLDIVKPDQLYLGQKDYQQCMVIKKLIEITSMQDEVKLVIGPTLREPDGLAMSSRNMRLNDGQRKDAVTISKVLQMINNEIEPGDTVLLKQKAVQMLEGKGFRVDYVEIADANDLSTITNWDGKKKIVALVAAFLGEIRLIDNLILV